jgi:predicted nucleic acid-binding protein
MATLVLDASVFLSWLFPDEENEWSRSVVLGLRKEDRAVVPAHWTVEVANGLLVGYRRKRIKSGQSTEFLDQLATIPIEIEAALPLQQMKWVVAMADSHSLTVYDAMYLELALRRNASLGTSIVPFARQLIQSALFYSDNSIVIGTEISRRIRRRWRLCRAGCPCWRRQRCRDLCF